MIRKEIKVLVATLVLAGLSTPSSAQPAAAPKQTTSSPTATLYRVDEGMFDIKRGQSIDLTDRKVLMTFTLDQHGNMAETKNINISFNGQSGYWAPGQRIDMRNWGQLAKIFKDKSVCFLDYIDLAIPKGAQPIATFRFECN
ncbi:MAG: hypothetical protein ABL901_16235 [Hyphomicrobiaceae bacterium]